MLRRCSASWTRQSTEASEPIAVNSATTIEIGTSHSDAIAIVTVVPILGGTK